MTFSWQYSCPVYLLWCPSGRLQKQAEVCSSLYLQRTPVECVCPCHRKRQVTSGSKWNGDWCLRGYCPLSSDIASISSDHTLEFSFLSRVRPLDIFRFRDSFQNIFSSSGDTEGNLFTHDTPWLRLLCRREEKFRSHTLYFFGRISQGVFPTSPSMKHSVQVYTNGRVGYSVGIWLSSSQHLHWISPRGAWES